MTTKDGTMRDEHDVDGWIADDERDIAEARRVLVEAGVMEQVAHVAVNWMAEHENAATALTWAKDQAATKTGTIGVAVNWVAKHEGEIVDASDGKILVGGVRCRLIAIHAGESIVGVPLGTGPFVSLRAKRVNGEGRVVADEPAIVPTLLFGDVGDAKETVAVLSSAILEKRMGAFMRGLADMEKRWPSVVGGAEIEIASGRVYRVVLERGPALHEHGPTWWSIRVAEGRGDAGASLTSGAGG